MTASGEIWLKSAYQFGGDATLWDLKSKVKSYSFVMILMYWVPKQSDFQYFPHMHVAVDLTFLQTGQKSIKDHHWSPQCLIPDCTVPSYTILENFKQVLPYIGIASILRNSQKTFEQILLNASNFWNVNWKMSAFSIIWNNVIFYIFLYTCKGSKTDHFTDR